MLARIFRGTGPDVIILIVLLMVVLWLFAFINPQFPGPAVYEDNPMPLYLVLKYVLGSNPRTGVIFSFLVLSFLLFLIINFNTTVFFINERTFLPAVVYLLLSALFPENQVLNPVLVSMPFLMLAMVRIMDAYRKPGIAYNFFDASILISLGSLLYANLIWFGIIVLIGIALLRTWNIREIAVAVLGLATPYIITIGLFYVIGRDLNDLFTGIRYNLFEKAPLFNFGRISVIVLIYSGLIILISVGFLMMRMNSKKIKSRKTFYLLLWTFVLSLVIYFFMPSASVEMIWIAAIPASYFLVHYVIFSRKRLIPEVILTCFFLFVALIQLLYII